MIRHDHCFHPMFNTQLGIFCRHNNQDAVANFMLDDIHPIDMGVGQAYHGKNKDAIDQPWQAGETDERHFRAKEVQGEQDLNCLSVSSRGECHVVSEHIAQLLKRGR